MVARAAGPAALRGLPRGRRAALLAAVLGGGAGWWLSRALGADPVPDDGVLAAIGVGALAGVRPWWSGWPS